MKAQYAKPDGPRMYAQPRPRMRGRYLIRSRKSAVVVNALDVASGMLSAFLRRAPVPDQPRRILVANWAHFGDVVLSLPALNGLRRRFPDATIGFLGASSSRAVLADMQLVDHIHYVDHFQLSRANTGRLSKIKTYLRMRRTAVAEMRDIGYDVAIDLYPFFPPVAPLFLAAGIPVRIGYTSGGLGSLLTHPLPWLDQPRSMIDATRDPLNVLLQPAPLKPGDLRALYPRHQTARPPELAGVESYTIVHMGAGRPEKEWPEDHWKDVISTLLTNGSCVVLTGAGQSEAQRAEAIADEMPGTIPLCRLNWAQFVEVVAGADQVICLDSVIGHLAACFSVPTVLLFPGMTDVRQWAPGNPNLAVLTGPVDCAPCNRWGCEAMACIRGITSTQVTQAALSQRTG